MATKQGKPSRKGLVVNIHHLPTPDAEARLSRAIEILLKAAARSTATLGKSRIAEEKKTPRCDPGEEGPAETKRVQHDV